eukprot:SM000235S08103  [mRNA]  locus=s235:7931:8872:- [translate_table: standard]
MRAPSPVPLAQDRQPCQRCPDAAAGTTGTTSLEGASGGGGGGGGAGLAQKVKGAVHSLGAKLKGGSGEDAGGHSYEVAATRESKPGAVARLKEKLTGHSKADEAKAVNGTADGTAARSGVPEPAPAASRPAFIASPNEPASSKAELGKVANASDNTGAFKAEGAEPAGSQPLRNAEGEVLDPSKVKTPGLLGHLKEEVQSFLGGKASHRR